MTGRLAGKISFITGAASGLGRAMAAAFVREGARVAIADVAEEGGSAVARELGPSAIFVRHAVTSEPAWESTLAQAVRHFGALHILVNNAGVGTLGDVERTSLEDWRSVQSVNLDGVFLGCKHAIRHIAAAGGGSIINMSSVAGLIGVHNMAAYCAARA